MNALTDAQGSYADCHATGAEPDGPQTTRMNHAPDVITSDVHYSYRHKVGGVNLDPSTESVCTSMPATKSQRMLRPPAGDNILFGTCDDAHGPDSYLPVVSESAFCALCHQFSTWGASINKSHQEWPSSLFRGGRHHRSELPFAPDRRIGDTCFALPEKRELAHPPERIPFHLQCGATDIEPRQDAVAMNATALHARACVRTSVTISYTRQEPTCPLAFRAGTAFAKVLRDVETGDSPMAS